MYGFASALWYLGFPDESEHVRMHAYQLEFTDRDSQIEGLRVINTTLKLFQECPIVWGQRKQRYKRFDIFNDISPNPTLVIPCGGDGGVQHAVTVVGNYIFDSTTKHALLLNKESLDWCCNTKYGYEGIFLAMRFELLPYRRPFRVA